MTATRDTHAQRVQLARRINAITGTLGDATSDLNAAFGLLRIVMSTYAPDGHEWLYDIAPIDNTPRCRIYLHQQGKGDLYGRQYSVRDNNLALAIAQAWLAWHEEEVEHGAASE